VLPPAWVGTLEYYFRPSTPELTGAPLNGQRLRQQVVLDLLHAVPFSAIVETGTYRGSTTAFLASHSGLPVHTVEALPRFFRYAKLRLRHHPTVRLACQDSREFLNQLARDPHFPQQNVFFYLDAHWYEDLPLREEVELVARTWKGAVVMIDDFEVPGDPGYAFDDFGPGKRLCLDYLPPLSSLGMEAFFPAAPSSAESGVKRGSVVLADRALADGLASLSSLRPYKRAAILPLPPY
jgi:hypothetical protein